MLNIFSDKTIKAVIGFFSLYFLIIIYIF